MKKIVCIISLMVPLSFLNASSDCVETNETIRAPEVVQKPVSEKERDHLMFTGFLGILVNFIKLFLDPTNIPEAKQNAYNIVMGVYNLAHVITRSGLTPAMQEELIMYIIKSCQEQRRTRNASVELI